MPPSWLEDDMDEIEVSPGMREAGARNLFEVLHTYGVTLAECRALAADSYVSVERARRAEIVPRIEDEPERNAGWKP
jgi:hypothetical protein